MKAIPIKIDGIQFRSKLEARWYLYMKRLGWKIMYEPEIKGLNNWIPDFLIIGKNKKILVDVKPIDTVEDWEKNPDRIRIENSGIKNLPEYELLILGTNLQLDGDSRMGLLYVRDAFWEEGKEPVVLQDYNSAECVFSIGDDGKQIGFMDTYGGWHCRITGDGGKTYLTRGNGAYNDADTHYKSIDEMWNEAGTQLQWNTPTSEYYLKGKTHPNKDQYCMDCKTKSINWWKRKNLFYCTKCKQVKPFYCYDEENLNEEEKRFSEKRYATHKAWTRGGEKITFYLATQNSGEWDGS